MSHSSLFSKLKKTDSFRPKVKTTDEVWIQLKFDDQGAYLDMVNSLGETVPVDPNQYSGALRDVFRTLDQIKQRSEFIVDWKQSAKKIYVADHPFLLNSLKNCDSFIGPNRKKMEMVSGAAKLFLVMETSENPPTDLSLYKSMLQIEHHGQRVSGLIPLNENHVFQENRIYKIPAVGGTFSLLPWFETELKADQIVMFLSLFFSNFTNVETVFPPYRFKEGVVQEPESTLIVEKIDQDLSLFMRVTQSLPNYPLHFLEEYEVSKVVALNEMEKTVAVCPVQEKNVQLDLAQIEGLLKKVRKQSSQKKGIEFYTEQNYFILEENLAREFVQTELSALLEKFTLYGTEKLKSFKVRPATPKLNLSLSDGLLGFLEGEAILDIEGDQFSLFDVIKHYKKQVYIPLSDGTNALIHPGYLKKLERIFEKEKDGVKLSFFDLPLLEDLLEEKIQGEVSELSRTMFEGFNDLDKQDFALPKLETELRPYQMYGFKWLHHLHKHKLGGCLADDMGLGKTLQSIALLASIYPQQKLSSLVIMPSSLLFNWASELNRFCPELSCYTYYGMDRNIETAKQHSIILTTYGMIRNDIESLRNEEFYYVILDESQNIKNINSHISKAVAFLNAKHRLALSGTPIENNLLELYSLFRFLNPSMFRGVDLFNRHYVSPIQQENDGDAAEDLKRKIYPFILRRLKKDVLQELPEKTEQLVPVEMNEIQKKMYDERRVFYRQMIRQQISDKGMDKTRFFVFQALSELRQIASIPEIFSDDLTISPKRELLLQHIQDATANHHKVLVFTNFLGAVENVSKDLEAAQIGHLTMTGASRDRQSRVEQFQTDPDCRVFVMTLKTGGVGLNLTAADTIFIFDPWWNKAAEDQAIDRAHRIGQEKTVFSYKLITQNTIEEKITQLQERKQKLFQSVISADQNMLKTLDEDDIEFILK